MIKEIRRKFVSLTLNLFYNIGSRIKAENGPNIHHCGDDERVITFDDLAEKNSQTVWSLCGF